MANGAFNLKDCSLGTLQKLVLKTAMDLSLTCNPGTHVHGHWACFIKMCSPGIRPSSSWRYCRYAALYERIPSLSHLKVRRATIKLEYNNCEDGGG